MATTHEALREHHRQLQASVNDLRRLADAMDDRDDTALLAALGRVIRFVQRDLLPYSRAEEAELYPVVALLLGAPEATATMSREHLEIIILARDLGRWSEALEKRKPRARVEIRRLLYSLHAVLMLHLAKEEEIYLPLLERALDPDGTAKMCEALRRTAESFRARAVHAQKQPLPARK